MTDPTVPTAPDRGATTGTSRWQVAVGAVGLVVVMWVGAESSLVDAWFTDGDGDGGRGGIDHGPGGGPRPGAEAPEGNPEQGPAPAPGGAHDPSQFEHGQP